jgi:hypothetical protein
MTCSRLPLVFLFLIALFGSGPAGAQTPGVMNPAEFVTELRRVAADVSAGEPGQVPRVRIPAVWTVEAGGQRFEMPALWLQRAMDTARRDPGTWPSQRAAVLAQLHALELEAQALDASKASPGAAVPAEAARAALTEVLSGPEFKGMAQEGAMARLRQRVSAWLLRVWQRLGGGVFGRRGAAVAFAWIAVIVALTVLIVWAVRLIRRPRNAGRFALAPPPERRWSARAWAREAQAAADAREAIRCAYRATIWGLEEEGAWRVDDTRTPREYLRILPRDHRRRGLVADVTRRFEEIWFGARVATDEDRAAILSRLKEMGCLPGA